MAKIPSLFKELFRIASVFDPKIHKDRYKEIYKFWDLMKSFIDNKIAFGEIIPYGFLELIRIYISLLSFESFLDNPNLHIPLDNSTANSDNNNFSSSFKSSKLSNSMIEKSTQKLNLISLVLHALHGLLEYEASTEKKTNLLENFRKDTLNESLNEKTLKPSIQNEKLPSDLQKDRNIVEPEQHNKDFYFEKPLSEQKNESPSAKHNNKKENTFEKPEENNHIEEINYNPNTLKPTISKSNIESGKDSFLELSEPISNLKLIYTTNREKKGFSEYLNNNSNLMGSSNSIIYICFDSLYEVLDSLMKKILPINNKESISCYCSLAEVTKDICKVLIVIKDVEFELITSVLNSLANACLYKYLENNLSNYPIFDYIIEASYLLYERFKIVVEKQIGLIFETLIKEKGFFKSKFLKKHVYLYFLNTVSKLNFKKIGWDLKNSLGDMVEILVMSLINFSDSINLYYLLIIMKQIILHYDIKTFPSIYEKINEILNHLFIFMKEFQEKLANPEKFDGEFEEIDKYVLIFCYENLLLLIYFQEFHTFLISNRLFPITLGIGSSMLVLLNNPNYENSAIKNVFKYKEDEIFNILKLIVMMLNHSSYYLLFHEQLASADMLSFLLELLMSNIKQLQLISFNSIINLIEANGLVLIKNVLEISLHNIEEINLLLIHKKNEKKVNLEPFLSILEHIYFSKDMIVSNENENEQIEIKNFIALLITNVIIEKHDLKLSKKILDIVFKEANSSIELEARLLMILLKIIYFSEGLIIDLRDTVLEFFRSSLRKKQEMIKSNRSFTSSLALVSMPTIKKFINSDIRTFKDVNSLENAFFWEYCSDSHTYFIIIFI